MCPRPIEDQLVSRQPSKSCRSLLKLCHLNKKGKILWRVFFENQIGKCIINFSNSERYLFKREWCWVFILSVFFRYQDLCLFLYLELHDWIYNLVAVNRQVETCSIECWKISTFFFEIWICGFMCELVFLCSNESHLSHVFTT